MRASRCRDLRAVAAAAHHPQALTPGGRRRAGRGRDPSYLRRSRPRPGTRGRSRTDSSPGAASQTAGIALTSRAAVPHETAGVVVTVVAHHLDVAGVARIPGHDDPVAAVPDGLGPIRRQAVVEAGHVLEDDPGLTVDDALHLEAHRGRRPLLDDAEPEVERLFGRQPLVHLAQLVDLHPEPRGQHLHRATPREREDAGDEQQWCCVERLPEAHRVEEHRRLRRRCA